ncbi:MAG: C-5 sterol desaturase, partial [Mycobacterium sp.]
MNAIADFLSVLPDQMRDPVLFAIPFFLLLLIMEWRAASKLERFEREAAVRSALPGSGAYLTADSWAS